MNPKPAQQPAEKFVVRLPGGMRQQIALQARHNSRSMNAEIIHRLQLTTDLEIALARALKTIDCLLATRQPEARS